MIYIVIPVFNRWNYTKTCLESLRKQTYKEYKVVVVDHGSTDGTDECIRNEFPEVVLLSGNDHMWWTAATNMGVRYALEQGADEVLTLNNDLVVMPDYLDQLRAVSTRNLRTITGSVSLRKDDPSRIIFAGINWNSFTAKYKQAIDLTIAYSELLEHTEVIETDLLPGRGTLIPSETFKEVGLFDEQQFPHYAADEDFSLRARRKGYHLSVAVKACVYSEANTTGIKGLHQKKNIAFWKDTFFSTRSPGKLSVRWLWAKKNGRVPLIYFLMDISRIFYSQLKNTL